MSNAKPAHSPHPLQYLRGQLHLSGMPLAPLARKVGTPCYVYSAEDMVARFKMFDGAFSAIPHKVCYAIKANSNLEVLRLFRRLKSGFDIVSGGELFRVIKAGAAPEAIVFSGVGKTVEEIDYALGCRVGQFNAESVEELRLLEARARALNRSPRVSLRVNPNVDPQTHPYIATGLRDHKFGIDIRLVPGIFRFSRSLKKVRLNGLGCHIGSQILAAEPFVEVARILARHVRSLRHAGFEISTLDLGGGLGISYQEETGPSPEDLARGMLPVLVPLGCELIFEPGRWLVGRAGVLLTRVLFTKRNGRKRFVIVDAGMNDLIRPTLYHAHHQILPARRNPRPGKAPVDVVGPICETGDFFARHRRMDKVAAGDLLVIRDVGAYGFALASHYNSHPRCPEVLVRGKEARIVRQRETYEDLLRGEKSSKFVAS
ncbi:MAG: diaminopimelate decarboxylase [Terriglobia bacterium]